ncbi:YihY/virulence factor BrkB family protein [Aerococcaceae bacterium DSM 111176]|nr:YihY/virulence factor BrkB family protein [Aerococcaceae bacterium DSM 111176]
MEIKRQSVLQKLFNTFQLNQQQIGFGSYAAELSFYVIWSIVPLALALANVVAVLPINQVDFVEVMQRVLPDEVEPAIMPLLESYLNQTSTGVFSFSLVISLWPASNIYNTLQRVLNTIYKVDKPTNAVLGRVFAYVSTIVVVIGGIALSFVFVFGETVLNFLRNTFQINLWVLDYIVQQSAIIGLISVFVALLFVYYFIPDIKLPFKYAIPGALFSTLGFLIVSQLFTIYVSMTNRGTGNGTMGVFVVFVIWLYFNSMILALGGYINIFVHDYVEKSPFIPYKGIVQETPKVISSDDYQSNLAKQAHFMNEIYKKPDDDILSQVTNRGRGRTVKR